MEQKMISKVSDLKTGRAAIVSSPSARLALGLMLLIAASLIGSQVAHCQSVSVATNEISQERLPVESRQQKSSEDLTATINYLDRMDKLFTQMARPRFGRSEYKQPNRNLFRAQGPVFAAPAQQPPLARLSGQQISLADMLGSRFAQRYNEAMNEAY